MATGHVQLALLSRTACRALMPGIASFPGEAYIAFSIPRNSTDGGPGVTDEAPSTSSRGDGSGRGAPHRPVPAPRRKGLAGLLLPSSSPWSCLLSGLPAHGAPAGGRGLAPAGITAPLLPWRALHSSGAAAAAGGPNSGSGTGGGAAGGRQPPEQQGGPVQNPLQAALQAAAGGAGLTAAERQDGLAGASRAAASGRGRERVWMWYDEGDERDERRKERQREQYGNSGTVYMMDVPQSMKKMNRILRLIRGLSYAEAVAQCQLVPHKAARYVLQALDAARDDATEKKGLRGERLVVGTIFVTKGQYEKGMQPMGKGGSGRKYARKSHLRVALRELAGRPAAFQARRVTPLMGVMTSAAASPWLARGPPAGGPPRQRFAYRVEV